MKKIILSLAFLAASTATFSAVVVQPTTLNTFEGGPSVQYRVYLDSTPSNGEIVTITPSSNDVTEGTVSGPINFNDSNFQTPQYITVTPGTDGINDGDLWYNINNAVSSSLAGGNYDGAVADTVDVTNHNTDGNRVIAVSPSDGFFLPEGGNQVITIEAGSQVPPQNDVTIDISTASTDVTLSSNSVTLNAGNGYSSTVTVTANDDMVANGDRTFSITTDAAVSADAGFQGINPVDINGMVLDNDSASYDLNIDVTGLAATNTVSFSNGMDTLTVNSNGINTLSTLVDGTPYAVSITTQPDTPNQTCAVTSNNANGNINASDVTVSVVCTTNTYSIGGSVSGLSAGNSVTLQNNASDDLLINANGGFVFPTALADGSAYTVSILSQPASQSCTLTDNTGTLNGSAVNHVIVTCATQTLSLDASTINFGNVFSGNSRNQTITVSNPGLVDVSITGINQPALPFSVTGGSCMSFPVILNPGTDCSFNLSFAPTTESNFQDTFEILSTSASSPDVVTLTGSSAIRSVPTLNQWGMVLLLLLLTIMTRRQLAKFS